MPQPSIEIRALELFAAGHKLSRAELRKALQLHPDTEITARVRALRKKGFTVECVYEPQTNDPHGDPRRRVHRYVLPNDQREKALLYLTERRAK